MTRAGTSPAGLAAVVALALSGARRRAVPRAGTLPAGLAVVALALVAGCQSAPAQPKFTAQQLQARTDYLSYWDALLRANAAGDAALPDLSRTAGGEQLAAARAGITRSKQDGVVARGTVSHDVRDIRFDGNLAYIVDCVDVRNWIQYVVATDTVRPNQFLDRPPTLGRFTLARRDNTWVVTQTVEMGSC